MNCVDVSENMVNAVDGRLNGHDRISFFEHIEHCRPCKNEYVSQQMIRSLLKDKTIKKDVPQELLNFVRLAPNHPNLNRTEYDLTPLNCSTDVRQNKLTILVWILIITTVFSLSAFYILNLH